MRFSLLFLIFSCDENEEEPCDTYFLTKETIGSTTTEFYYRDDGLIDSLFALGDFLNYSEKFHYDSHQRLTDVASPYTRIGFYYDDENRLLATIRHDSRGEFLDSLHFEYDGSDRLIKRSIYSSIYPRPYLQTYYQVDYSDAETIRFNFYERADVIGDTFKPGSTFVYTMDENPKPYSTPYDLLYLAWGNTLLPHNELSLTIYRDGDLISTQTYEYRYNAGGFPVEKGSYQFTYACDPR